MIARLEITHVEASGWRLKLRTPDLGDTIVKLILVLSKCPRRLCTGTTRPSSEVAVAVALAMAFCKTICSRMFSTEPPCDEPLQPPPRTKRSSKRKRRIGASDVFNSAVGVGRQQNSIGLENGDDAGCHYQRFSSPCVAILVFLTIVYLSWGRTFSRRLDKRTRNNLNRLYISNFDCILLESSLV